MTDTVNDINIFSCEFEFHSPHADGGMSSNTPNDL